MTDPRRAERQWLAMAVAMQMMVLVGGQEEAKEQDCRRKANHHRLRKRRVGRPPKPLRRPRGREQSCMMRGQQAIKAAVIRGEEIPMGHVVTEEWPKQTSAISKPTRSWVKKRKEKEATKRYHQNKQARACRAEQVPSQNIAPQPEEKEQLASPPKHVQRRERAKQEREAKRLHGKPEREKRKREDDEHKADRQRERELRNAAAGTETRASPPRKRRARARPTGSPPLARGDQM